MIILLSVLFVAINAETTTNATPPTIHYGIPIALMVCFPFVPLIIYCVYRYLIERIVIKIAKRYWGVA